MKLAQLQHLFWRSMRYDPAPPEVDKAFVDHGAMSARQRMAVYRNMYWYRQVEALGSCFPRLREVLGLERFTKLACKYIRAYPSEHGALERFGRKLEQLMVERAEPRLAVEVCRIEWARMDVLVAPEPDDIATFDKIDPHSFATSHLRFVQALQVVDSSQQALALWTTAAGQGDDQTTAGNENINAAGGDAAARVSSAAVADAPAEDSTSTTEAAQSAPQTPAQRQLAAHDGHYDDARAAVWRKGYRVFHRALAADESEALDAARQGASLAAICALFLDGAEDQQVATQRAFEVLRGWINGHWVEAIAPSSEASI